MKFDILNRWSGAVQFTAEIECAYEASRRIKIGLSLRWAVANKADLRDAILSDADLRGIDLSFAVLRDAVLRDALLSGAILRGIDLRDALLSDADLRDADLSFAVLRDAVLRDADLRDADLSGIEKIKADFFNVLAAVPAEVPGLRQALVDGRVDGTVYEGECACLVGTIANLRHVDYQAMPELQPNAMRPIERWFLGVSKGKTPETSRRVKEIVEWIDEWAASHAGPVEAA